jgi:hypothetical protein
MASSSQAALSSPTKKVKKHKKSHNRSHVDKGKSRATNEGVEENAEIQMAMTDGLREEVGSSSSSSDFVIVQSTMRLPLAPVFAEDPLEGVRQALESWIMRWASPFRYRHPQQPTLKIALTSCRYLTSIDAVLLTISWPPTLLEENAPLTPSSAFAMARVRWQGVAFRPQIASPSSALVCPFTSIQSQTLTMITRAFRRQALPSYSISRLSSPP